MEAADTEAVGLWQLKRLLLTAHPGVRYSHEAVTEAAVRWSDDEMPDQGYYRWMRTDLRHRQGSAFGCSGMGRT